MVDKLSLSQVLYGQTRQQKELDKLRADIKKINDSGKLDEEIERLNRSPYVADRPYHKIQQLKGSSEESSWRNQPPTVDEIQADASLTLKKLNII